MPGASGLIKVCPTQSRIALDGDRHSSKRWDTVELIFCPQPTASSHATLPRLAKRIPVDGIIEIVETAAPGRSQIHKDSLSGSTLDFNPGTGELSASPAKGGSPMDLPSWVD